MNFKFTNLLGAPYRGGTLLLHGNELFSAVGNRVAVTDLVKSTSVTLPFESPKQVRVICASPDDLFVLTIDEDGRCLLINRRRRALLHRFSFKAPVRAAAFSPDGRFLAAAVGKILQVWRAPGTAKVFAPMQLHRTYGGCHADLTSLDWSPDSFWLAVSSKDLSARVFSLEPVEGYRPPTLAGHKDTVLAAFFAGPKVAEDARLSGETPAALYTVSRDGALFCWAYERPEPGQQQQQQQPPPAKRRRGPLSTLADGAEGEAGAGPGSEADARAAAFSGGSWRLAAKRFFNKRGARLSSAAFHKPTGLLVAGFSSGVFEILEMPAFASIHTLSVSQSPVTSLALNASGEWLALGCAALGQLLVWEWRSETYVLKQQGHYWDVATLAYSPDGAFIATGADDAKVKLWSPASGACVVTFAQHTGPVTGVAFLPSSSAVVTASLDGTVRAFDLLRYRNFRTMTSPQPRQFSCVAVDPSGEVVVAGSQDEFEIFVWAVKTGRLLDVLAAHTGPVSSLAFSPGVPLLASGSWDRSVRTWDVFGGKGALEELQHSHDVLAIAFRPDGRLLAAATLDGTVTLWSPQDATVQGTIEGRRDLAGGRSVSDRRAAGNSTSGQAFTSLAFSADGSWLLAGGASKYVCLYDVAERVLLRRFQTSANASLDGVRDQLDSRRLTDAGPLDLIDDAPSDDDEGAPRGGGAGGPAGASRLPGTGGSRRPAIRCRAVALSPAERQFAAATTEGLLLYSLDEGLVFDPTDLGQDVTPQAAAQALAEGRCLRAALIALRLGDAPLLRHVLLSTPPAEVATVAADLPTSALPGVLRALAEALAVSPHLEFLLDWARAVCTAHGPLLQAGAAGDTGPPLRALQRSLAQLQGSLTAACDSNMYTLRYLSHAVQPAAASQQAA